ncbi:uncharacterized protein BP5553_08174 [Venustampulla echinocandica]|uniref:Uncharacterized protein n=1 Tax=Venustampulla echinocandica TaxID=2656787 RepID=A0A370TFY1_9HELO|nr:uncharacterized protein BP5553_08174 [Venustampulla echinocandica]RDL33806.1 hypothetical protein BP5553_08174 [Venustampulla echinocandica]
MRSPSIPSLSALLLLSGASTALATKISVPSTIAAGAEVTVTIPSDLIKGFDNFRVYLSTTPPGWASAAVCYLVNSTPINTESLKVQIPPTVGPSGKTYSIAARGFNGDGKKSDSAGFQSSNDFELTGGTGQWSEQELQGFSMSNPDTIPCGSYGCIKDCNTKFLTDDIRKAGINAYKPAYECFAACPGVKLPSWEVVLAQSGAAPSSSSAVASSTSAVASSTVAPAPTNNTTAYTNCTSTAYVPSSTAQSNTTSLKTPGAPTAVPTAPSAPAPPANAASSIQISATLLFAGIMGLVAFQL